MPDLAELGKRARENLQNISSLVTAHKLPKGQPFFFEIDRAILMVQRIDQILCDMTETNSRANDINIAIYKAMSTKERTVPESISLMLNELHKLNGRLERDFESLYREGTILLEQLSVISFQIAGLPRIKSNFSKLVKRFMNGDPVLNPVTLVWTRHKKEILAHYSNFKLFRDKFVDHSEVPSTPSTNSNLTEKKFRLVRLPRPSPSEEDEIRISNELHKLASNGSDALQTAINGEKGLALCRELLKYSHEFEWNKIESIKGQAAKFGVETPYFDKVGEDILQLTADWAATLLELARTNMDQINLG